MSSIFIFFLSSSGYFERTLLPEFILIPMLFSCLRVVLRVVLGISVSLSELLQFIQKKRESMEVEALEVIISNYTMHPIQLLSALSELSILQPRLLDIVTICHFNATIIGQYDLRLLLYC